MQYYSHHLTHNFKQLATLSGQEAKQLIQGISFSSDQVKIIRLIARLKLMNDYNSMKMHSLNPLYPAI